jgi:gliding motility-associated-like protein
MRILIFLPIWMVVSCSSLFSQIKADFSYDKNEGCGSLAVSFTDKSTSTDGEINEWTWDLGGVVSTKQNPGTIFTKPGEFTICLTVKTSTGATAKVCKEKVIKVFEEPVADFGVSVLSSCVPASVVFNDQSKTKNNKITTWLWDIGGSANLITTSDSTMKINTTYTSAGKYTATLSVTDAKGCKSIVTKPNIIEVNSIVAPNLDIQLIRSCQLPWQVKYSILNLDPQAKYLWDMGNGQKVIGSNPSLIQYQEPKQYSVSIVVEKGACKDTFDFNNAVNANRIVDFEVASKALCVGQNISLKDNSNFDSDSLWWDFGDGTFSKEKNPEKTFEKDGCYKIKLTKYLNGCSTSMEKPCVNILKTPLISYSATTEPSCAIPKKTSFKANVGEPGSYEWKITGVNLDTLIAVKDHSFSFNSYGEYVINLTYKSEHGCISSIESKKISIHPFKVTLPEVGPTGCIPYQTKLSNQLTSTDPIVKWKWEVGNPAVFTSTEAEPIFNVNQEGRMDLLLIAENGDGCKDTLTKSKYIWGGTHLSADFTTTPQAGCMSDERIFTPINADKGDTWSWFYNDTALISNEKSPKFEFPDVGDFDITMSTTYNGCQTQVKKNKYIKVHKPKSAFKVDYNCEEPKTIKIQNQSIGADSLYWVVKLNEMKSDTINDSLFTSYTFPDRGIYFLSHFSKNYESGCEHVAIDTIFIVDLEASYTLDTIKGCAPLSVKISTKVQDAVSSRFLDGQFSITNPATHEYTAVFNEDGNILSPKLEVKDRHGCLDTFQTTVPVQVSKLQAKIESKDVFCVPDTGIFRDISIVGSVPLTERQWSFTYGNQSGKNDTARFNMPEAGTFYATLKLKNQWGCVDSIKKEITGISLIPVFSGDTLSCSSKDVVFNPNSDSATLNKYKWDFGDGAQSEEKTPTHRYAAEGKYDVCAEFFDSRGCSKKICKPQFVTIKNPKAAFTGTPISAPCPPLVSDFQNISNNASRFTWDFGDNSGLSYNEHPAHVYTKPGNYTLTLMAELVPGCVDTIIKPDYIKLLGPKADMEAKISGNCIPMSLSLSATSDNLYEYIWDMGDGTINIVPGLNLSNKVDYKYLNAGIFVPKLLVKDENGCIRTFLGDSVFVNQLKADFLAPVVPLCGLSPELKLQNKTTSSSATVQFDWKIEGTNLYKSAQKDPVINLKEYGKYNIVLTASAPNCVDSIRKDSIVEVAALPIIKLNEDNSVKCQHADIKLGADAEILYGKADKWKWRMSNGFTSSDKNIHVVFDSSGTYQVNLTAQTDKGCVDSIKRDLIIQPNTVKAFVEDKIICLGDSVNIKAQVSSSETFSFKWLPHTEIKCDTCRQITVKPKVSTAYFFDVVNQYGCTISDTANVKVLDFEGPKVTLSSDTTICNGGFASIKILDYNNQYTYEWDKSKPGLDCYSNCQTVTARPKDSTSYWVTAKNSFGCIKADTILVRVEKNFPDFLVESKTICENKSTILNLTGGNNPIWRPDPTMSCNTCLSPTVVPDKDKYYYATISSEAGCRYQDSVLVKILRDSTIYAGDDVTVCKGEKVNLSGKGQGLITWISPFVVQSPANLKTNLIADSTSLVILTSKVDECLLRDTMMINVLQKTTIQSAGDSICPGQTTNLKVLGDATTYIWYFENKKIGEGNALTFRPDSTVTLKVVGTRTTCVPDTSDIQILVFPKINYQLDRDHYKVFINTKDQIEATFLGDYTYKWQPSIGLDCDDCPEPIIKNITESAEYSVEVNDQYGCVSRHIANVILDPNCNEKGFYIPNIFTPYRKDGGNNNFKVYTEDASKILSISVYDRWGNKVFYTTNPEQEWDGYLNGNKVSAGVYIYQVTAICTLTNTTFTFAGDLTLIE